jgi:polyisoprenoid-binding protein YceI
MRARALTLALSFAALPALTWAADTYKVDAAHSAIVFRVKHMNTSNSWGRFNDVSGTFGIDGSMPTAFDFTVKAASIDTANEKRDTHLKSPDFLNVRQFPTITFKSKDVKKNGELYEVTGDLTLHGVTKPVMAKVEVTGTGKGPTGGAIAGFEATLDIKRSEFGMTFGVPNMVGDDVRIIVSAEGGK